MVVVVCGYKSIRPGADCFGAGDRDWGVFGSCLMRVLHFCGIEDYKYAEWMLLFLLSAQGLVSPTFESLDSFRVEMGWYL